MSQATLELDAEVDDGVSLVTKLEGWRDAVNSSHRGTSRPDYAAAGSEWVKVVSSSIEQVMRFDGTNDILIGTYNPITHTWTTAGQGDTVIAVTASRTLDVNNALYVVDSSAGPVELTLLPGATAGEPFNNRIKWEAGANAVTYVPSGDNTINGATGAQTISAVGETVALSLDVDVDPDNWTSVSTVAGMQAANALAEIAALGLQSTARANISAASAANVATLTATVATNLDTARHGDLVLTGISFTNNQTVTVPHTLGVRPSRFEIEAECVTAQSPYAVGDIKPIPNLTWIQVNVGNYGIDARATATNLIIVVANLGLGYFPSIGGAPAAANWRLRARLWK